MDKLSKILYESLEENDLPDNKLNEKVLRRCSEVMKKKKEEVSSGKKRKTTFFGGLRVATVMLVTFLLCGVSIYTIARETGLFTLKTGDTEIDMSKMEPISIDYDNFISKEGTEKVLNSDKYGITAYYHIYKDVKTAEEDTGLLIWDSEKIEVMSLSIALSEDGTGNLSSNFMFDGNEVVINGQFVFGEKRDNIGYGTEVEYYRTYEYGEGLKAYFVKDTGYDDSCIQVVYFTSNNIQYQLFVERSDAGTNMAEEVIDIISNR